MYIYTYIYICIYTYIYMYIYIYIYIRFSIAHCFRYPFESQNISSAGNGELLYTFPHFLLHSLFSGEIYRQLRLCSGIPAQAPDMWVKKPSWKWVLHPHLFCPPVIQVIPSHCSHPSWDDSGEQRRAISLPFLNSRPTETMSIKKL
jgi:hypothetical protein